MTDVALPVVSFSELDRLDPDIVKRCTVFACRLANLTRNRPTYGDHHVPVALVTDSLEDIYALRPLSDREPDDYVKRFVGTCWNAHPVIGPPAIWINRYAYISADDTTDHGQWMVRSKRTVVQTFTHELAHAFTNYQHGWSFRRMFALLGPHIYEACGEAWHVGELNDLIRRYTSHRLTERRLLGGVGYEFTYPSERRAEESNSHMVASRRMQDRVLRENLVL